jgi:DNA-binding CsgD family transcriptional regulator
VADTLEALAGIAASLESVEEAARLFGAAKVLREEMGYVRFAIPQRQYDADVALLGPDREAAWQEGEQMTIEAAVAYAQRGRGERNRPSSGWPSLTPTETEVVKLVREGLTNPQIADQLFISSNTVRAHMQHIFAKLGVKTRAELASEATRRAI